IYRHLAAVAAAVVVLIAGVGILGAKTELAGAVVAAGSLVVESNVKKVAHPTGGVVGDLRVHDGSTVREGDVLIRLHETVARATLAAIKKNLWELGARQARLQAERDGDDAVTFPDDLTAIASEPAVARILAGETKLFASRREALQGQKAQLNERIG